MRVDVQNLRDRLKSGLRGWFENIRFQYRHLEEQRRRSQQSASCKSGLHRASSSATPLSSSQVQQVAQALKEQGSEIDGLMRAVERLNIATASQQHLAEGSPIAKSSASSSSIVF